MKKIVISTGAGISAESGIKTFRDSDGLWENYKIEDVATPRAFKKNPKLVLDYYNERRKQVLEVEPNIAHKALVDLEKNYDVHIITQNIDDLHERAGSKNILHLHGEIKKSRSSLDPNLIYDIEGWEMKLGDKCEKGSQLRPHIVWFTEDVPKMAEARELVKSADVFIVIGTSLQVYPASTLIRYTKEGCEHYFVDPKASENSTTIPKYYDLKCINKVATEGVVELVKELLEKTNKS